MLAMAASGVLGESNATAAAPLEGDAGGRRSDEFVDPLSAHVRGDVPLSPLEERALEHQFRKLIPHDQLSSHWSFRPVSLPTPPERDTEGWARNEIDAFVWGQLEELGVSPSEQASPSTLLRRLYLDLTGLLPSEEVVSRFEAEASDEAYDAVVDELLSSPHFGERWAVYWLDAARYADSVGYAHDDPRTIWPYRDYVIRAFNRDLPFDQFVIEQLAGDLLDDPTTEALLASGFHRNTPTNTEGGIDEEEFRVERIKDRVNTTAKVFMGLTLECAQCHDHLYDPLTQNEYYQFYAFFNDAEETAVPRRLTEPDEEVELLTFSQLEAPRETFVQRRGDFRNPGELVEPGVPAVLPPLHADGRADRLDLALWLTSAEHPLLARVTVNRIWQALFGLGLVETEDDFGTRGEPPSHPELLDWLASRFVDDGWSVKSLLRRIVTSATYRQASALRDDVDDPKNRLLARQSRLRVEAEVIRDITLQAAGLLELSVGGPSVYPPIPDGVLDTGRGKREWPVSEGGDRYRRGIYTFLYRTVPHPSLIVFDAPDAVVSTTRRPRSNTFMQALTLLNDETFFEAALHFGADLSRREGWDDAERLLQAFRRTLSRDPEERELAVLRDLLVAERTGGDSGGSALAAAEGEASDGRWPALDLLSFDLAEASAWTAVARVLLNLDEFITRE